MRFTPSHPQSYPQLLWISGNLETPQELNLVNLEMTSTPARRPDTAVIALS
jgi:hypothetical protein